MNNSNTPGAHEDKSDARVNTSKSGLGKLSFSNTFSALKHRNYRLWFTGQLVSLLGTWMQNTALGFFVFQLTHSAVYLGYVGFAIGVPSWIFSAYAGIVADRFPRRSILIICQVSMMVLAFLLAGMTFAKVIQPYQIVIFAFLLGIANSFDAPARQSFVLEMVSREDMINAIALNSTMFNTGTAIGPAIAGITYAVLGPAWCFGINGLSFIGVIAALMMMKLKPFIKPRKNQSVIDDLKDGFRYLAGQKLIMLIMLQVAVLCIFGISFGTIFPAWAVKILHGDAAVNGFLQSARGVGALIGALFLASFSRYKYKMKMMSYGTIIFPALLIVLSFINWIPLSLFVLVLIGASSLLVLNLANGMLQTLVSDEYRGRIMGLYTLTFFGMMPLGALIVGTLAHVFGETAALQINGTILLLISLIVHLFVPKHALE